LNRKLLIGLLVALVFLSVLAYTPSFTADNSSTVDEGPRLLVKPLELFPKYKDFWTEVREWIHIWFGGCELNWMKVQAFPEVQAQGSASQVAEFQPKAYVVPIVNGVVLDVQQYDVSVNGYRVYNANISVDVTWDGTSAVDYFSVLNWTWHLQEKIKGKWMAVEPSSMSISSTSDDLGCYVTRTGTLTDGSTFIIKYSLPNNGELKFSLGYKPTATESYRLWFEVKGLQDENSGSYLPYSKPNAKRVRFTLPPYIGGSLDFDYNDIALTSTEEFDSTGFKYNFYIDVGRLTADGTTYTYDPTTVGTTAGQYATSLGNNRKLFRDAYGKYLALWKNANVLLGYCNNDPPTSGWTQNDLGSSFAVSNTTEKTGVAGAYDSANDRLLVVFVNGKTVKQARITFTRDGSNNITGYTAGSILTIDLTTATGGNSNIDAAYNPSAWMLHNGEVQVVAGGNSTAGAKTGRVYGWRVVFGSPPTFKDDAGTASTIDAIGNEYTTNHTTHYPTVVQRTNSGTGQYDLYAFYSATDGTSSHVTPKKVKATWSSPNWGWGSESSAPAGFSAGHNSSNYDTTNGLIVFVFSTLYVTSNNIYVGTIDSSDSQTDISKSGLSGNIRYGVSLAINGSDYYVFYHIGATPNGTIYYIKRTAGSWGSETSFASAAECYPSVKTDGAGNRIELIWTHYTGSAYNIYYDYIALGQQLSREVSGAFTFTFTPSKIQSLTRQQSLGVTFTAAASATQTLAREVSAQFNFTFQTLATKILEREVSLPIAATLNAIRMVSTSRENQFSITGAFNAVREESLTREGLLSAAFDFLSSKFLSTTRESILSLIFSFLGSREASLKRDNSLTITATFNALREASYARETGLSPAFTFLGSREQTLTRANALSLTLDFIASRIGSYLRESLFSAILSLTTSRQASVTKEANLTITSTFDAVKTGTYLREGALTVTSTFQAIASLVLNREVNLPITGTFNAVRQVEYQRENTFNATIQLLASRISGYAREQTLSITGTFNAVREAGYLRQPALSIVSSWLAEYEKAGFITREVQQAFNLTFNVVRQASYGREATLSPAFSFLMSTQQSLTRENVLSATLSFLASKTQIFTREASLTITSTFNAIREAQYTRGGVLSLTMDWFLYYLHTPKVAPPGPGYSIFEPFIRVFEGLLGALQAWPAFGYPLPLTNVKVDVTITNMDTVPHDASVALRVVDENNREVWSMRKTYEDLKPGPSTYTVWIPIRQEGSYTVDMTVQDPSILSIHESRQYFTVTWLELWASTIIVVAVIVLIVVAVKRRRKPTRRYFSVR